MYFLGIDVSKAKFDCCIYPQGLAGKHKNKVFPNASSGFKKLKEWLIGFGVDLTQTKVVMEATSVYHENLAHDLYISGLQVCIAHPARVRAFAKGLSMLNKTDKADSQALAYYAATVELKLWHPLPENINLLKALTDRRAILAVDLRREKNRLEKAESTQTVVQVITSLEDNIEYFEKQIAALDQMIDDHIDQNPDLKNDRKLLSSIPAIGERTSLLMLGLLHSHQFDSAKQTAAYVGLVPVQHQSGSSVNARSRISKAGSSKIRSGLYMAAVVAVTHNPQMKAMYEKLVNRGKAKMSALCAVMRKLIHLCFGVIKHQTPYQSDYLVIKIA